MMHTQNRGKNFGEVRFGIRFLLYTFLFAKFRSHINLKEDQKQGNKHKRQAVTFPSERGHFALFDILSASHNPTVAPQPPLKSTRITYDTISCNNEATKESGI